ncbi:G-protein coupled receptor 4-like [Micropterus dolomieu]|uniref:G-protein coupled receptor 4-like n=1 Tax=Micropterus dolomieu TaxID=147949 RepID=UPI001E8CC86F|nr:G-protein coupled receptor 4-like [Micropterus dolomieu]
MVTESEQMSWFPYRLLLRNHSQGTITDRPQRAGLSGISWPRTCPNYSSSISNYQDYSSSISNYQDYSSSISNYQDYSSSISNYQDYSSSISNYQDYSSSISNYQDYSSSISNYQDYSSSISNYQDYTEFYEYYRSFQFSADVVTCIVIAVGLPLTLVAIYGLYSMVRSDHVAPIYIINLLITDLLQFCCMIVQVAPPDDVNLFITFYNIYLSVLMASVSFMVCVALERYLVIVHPLWYRFRRTIKTSVALCVLVWVLSAVCGVIHFHFIDIRVTNIIYAVLFLHPFPLLILFLVGTLKALSASISVPSDEKRRIVEILVLVLLIYTLLFLPKIISLLRVNDDEVLYILLNIIDYLGVNPDVPLNIVSLILVKLSPLADLVLYVLMRKGFIDKILASVCCCRMDSNDISSPSV